MMIRPYLHNAKYMKPIKWELFITLTIFAGLKKQGIDYLNQIGLTYKKWEELSFLLFLSINCNYQKMMYFDDNTTVKLNN